MYVCIYPRAGDRGSLYIRVYIGKDISGRVYCGLRARRTSDPCPIVRFAKFTTGFHLAFFDQTSRADLPAVAGVGLIEESEKDTCISIASK